AALRPGPAPRGPVALEDLLDRSGVDVDREAGAVVGHARRGGVRALHLPPDLPLVPAVRLVPLRAPVRDPVTVEEDLLLLLDGAQRVVELEVGIRFRNRERREVRERLSSGLLELLVPVLVRPAGGKVPQ